MIVFGFPFDYKSAVPNVSWIRLHFDVETYSCIQFTVILVNMHFSIVFATLFIISIAVANAAPRKFFLCEEE